MSPRRYESYRRGCVRLFEELTAGARGRTGGGELPCDVAARLGRFRAPSGRRIGVAHLANGLPPRQCVGERTAVHILELAADRHAVGDTAGANASTGCQFAEKVGSGLPFDRRVCRENDFAHDPFVVENRPPTHALRAAPGPIPSSGDKCPIKHEIPASDSYRTFSIATTSAGDSTTQSNDASTRSGAAQVEHNSSSVSIRQRRQRTTDSNAASSAVDSARAPDLPSWRR